MAYVKIIYQDSPSTATPLNAQNLNHMDDGIAENDRRLNELATAGVVNTFNGRRGAVTPESGDYTADMIPYDEENSVGDILGNATSEIDGITVANASGESFALVPTSEGNALATHIFGMSTQNGTPTPSSPVDIESSVANFKCVGKNLNIFPYKNGGAGAVWSTNGIDFTVQADGSVDVHGVATGDAYFRCGISTDDSNPIYLEEGKQYILSRSGNANIGVRLRDSSNTGVANATTEDVTYQCLSSGKYYILLSIPKNSNLTHVLVKPMLRLATVEDSTYEPYKHTDITTDLTLRAIEVTSSDDYNLIRDGKYYIADTVDWNEDEGYVLTRRIAHREYDGTEEGWAKGGATTTDVYYIPDNEAYSVNNVTDMWARCILSNRFAPDTNGGTLEVGQARDANTRLYFGYATPNTTTLSDWTTFLSNNHVIIDFIKEKYTTTPLTSEQAQSLLSLKTYDVSTSINAQANPEPTVELEYAKTQTTALALSGHNEALIAQELEGLYGAKNLIPYPYHRESGYSTNGLTVTYDDEGVLTVNKVAGSATAYFAFFSNTLFPNAEKFLLPNTDYILSVNLENALNTSIYASSLTGVDMVAIRNKTSGYYEARFTTPSEISSLTVALYYGKDIVETNCKVKAMIRLATNTSNTYQPYAMSNYELTQKIRELETAIIELGGN